MKNSSCEICDKLGKQITVDYLEGEKFPSEYKELITVPETDNEVLRCPICGQAYIYSNEYDNDVYNLYNYGKLYQIDENKVKEKIEYYKKKEEEHKQEIKRFWYKARKKFKDKLEKLPENEKRIIEYLKEKTIWGEYLDKIAKDLSFQKESIIEIVGSLEKSGLIYKKIIYPLHPGKYNFQEEIKDVDPYDYTKISINI